MTKTNITTANINVTINVPTINLYLTPYFLAKISEGLFKASLNYKSTDAFPLVNHFLFLSSIEKGLKAVILAKNHKEIKELKSKKIGHNLVKLLEKFSQYYYLEKILTKKQQLIINNVNDLYVKKGFEYFDSVIFTHTLKGFKNIPELDEIKKIAIKVNNLLKKNQYFVNSTV